MYAILDIDGCCLDNSARIHHLLAGDTKSFHENWHLDSPIRPGVVLYKSLMENPDLTAVFVTARSEPHRHYTTVQLTALFGKERIRRSRLLMRPPEDTLHDADLKLGLLASARIRHCDILMCFDDRPSVIKAYRDLGLVAYQTAEGW